MNGYTEKTKEGYVVYGESLIWHKIGFHGKGDQGFAREDLTDCTPFNRINEAKSYIKRHLKDNAEILHVRMDITYNYKTIKRCQ